MQREILVSASGYWWTNAVEFASVLASLVLGDRWSKVGYVNINLIDESISVLRQNFRCDG